jgi:hypothetical protein
VIIIPESRNVLTEWLFLIDKSIKLIKKPAKKLMGSSPVIRSIFQRPTVSVGRRLRWVVRQRAVSPVHRDIDLETTAPQDDQHAMHHRNPRRWPAEHNVPAD